MSLPKQQQAPDPGKVNAFAAQLQQAGIDPQEFAAHFPYLASMRRHLLGSQRTDVSDYIQVSAAIHAQGTAVTQRGIIDQLRSQPHPAYPTISVGEFQDTYSRASLYSVMHTKQVPTNGEVARMVGMQNREIADYYQQKSTLLAAQPQPRQQQGGKIAQLRRSA